MPLPTGATTARYQMYVYVDGSEIIIPLEHHLDPPVAEQVDAALQAGAEAIAASLQASYPDRTVSASRQCIGTLPGDPWPTPEPEEP